MTTNTEAADQKTLEASTDEARQSVRVQWDDSRLATNFSNVVNIQSTQEQVDLFFGVNHSWSGQSETPSIRVELTNRMILGPHAAKRFWKALGGVIADYERRYGKLGVDGAE